MSDRYCYDDTEVLVNKYNIKDKAVLAEFESESTNTKLISLELRPEQIREDLSAEHLKEIHKFIFGKLYNWAGEFRDVDMMKAESVLSGASVDYTHFNNVVQELDEFMFRALKFDWSNREKSITSTFQFLIEIWEIHPFRDGNTRTCIMFMKRYLSSKGIEFNAKLLKEHPFYVRDSLVMATYDEPKYLLKIIADSFVNKHNDIYFNEHEVLTDYIIAKEQFYTVTEVNEIKAKKRNNKNRK